QLPQEHRHPGPHRPHLIGHPRRRRRLRRCPVRPGPHRQKRGSGNGGPHPSRAYETVIRGVIRRLGVTLLLTALVAGCSTSRPQRPGVAPDLGHALAGKVTADAMFAHLRALQAIADANKGNRAEGTPGYDASVDYVAKVLHDRGFDVSTPQFERLY